AQTRVSPRHPPILTARWASNETAPKRALRRGRSTQFLKDKLKMPEADRYEGLVDKVKEMYRRPHSFEYLENNIEPEKHKYLRRWNRIKVAERDDFKSLPENQRLKEPGDNHT
ncbi:hypothetical protein PRIPAC_73662, partial [Pristionchus pacificus]